VSTLAIVLIALGVVVVLFFAGGVLGARRRDRALAPDYARNLAEADRALEQARAADRGWDRAAMEESARAALSRRHPDSTFERLDLVLVDDRPGVTEDRAQFEAWDGERHVGIALSRGESGWVAD
jgi:hypothetical protein